MTRSGISAEQRGRAKALRQMMNRAETLLWRHLKAGRLGGLQFRRQAPIGRYIVNFVCHTRGLIIELDGESHEFVATAQADLVKDASLASQGLRVLRFRNDEVMANLYGVLTAIRAAASEVAATPLPSPPPQGGREPASSGARQQSAAVASAHGAHA